jgi:hypothetical protein
MMEEERGALKRVLVNLLIECVGEDARQTVAFAVRSAQAGTNRR